MTSRGFEMPPDQKASQMRSIWLLSSPVSMGLLGFERARLCRREVPIHEERRTSFVCRILAQDGPAAQARRPSPPAGLAPLAQACAPSGLGNWGDGSPGAEAPGFMPAPLSGLPAPKPGSRALMLCELLLARSREAWFTDPAAAVELSELAVVVSD